jgi:hypothetical protein
LAVLHLECFVFVALLSISRAHDVSSSIWKLIHVRRRQRFCIACRRILHTSPYTIGASGCSKLVLRNGHREDPAEWQVPDNWVSPIAIIGV